MESGTNCLSRQKGSGTMRMKKATGNKKFSKTMKITATLSSILIVGAVIWTLIINAGIGSEADKRDKRLELYEVTKLGVIEDLRSYFTVGKDNFDKVKENVNMTDDLKGQLFGSTYNATKMPTYEKVSFIDVQYTIDKTDEVMFYVLCNVTKDGKTQQVNMLVTVSGSKVSDIIAY